MRQRLREALGISQEALAHAVGLSGRSAVSKIESGENDIRQTRLVAIASALHTTPAALIDGDHPDSSSARRSTLPVLGDIAGGTPIEALQQMDSDDTIDVSPDYTNGNYIALRVNGRSMEPQIADGAIAVIRLSNQWKNGAVMAVYIDDYTATLKKVRLEQNGILMLQPFNPEYETRIFTPEEQRSHHVTPLGILVEHRTRW